MQAEAALVRLLVLLLLLLLLLGTGRVAPWVRGLVPMPTVARV